MTSINYLGTWSPGTNTPRINNKKGDVGDYYVISEKGDVVVDGNFKWDVGDYIIFNGSEWKQVKQTSYLSPVGTDNGDQFIYVGHTDGLPSWVKIKDVDPSILSNDFLPHSYVSSLDIHCTSSSSYEIDIPLLTGDLPTYEEVIRSETTPRDNWEILKLVFYSMVLPVILFIAVVILIIKYG